MVLIGHHKLKILVLIKPFWINPRHMPKVHFIKSLEKYADIYYWHQDGHIQDIIKKLNIVPHFIFHYDIAWNYALAPNIYGLSEINILKGCFVIDLHWNPKKRIEYLSENKIDLIFSATKHPFLKTFPQFKQHFRWLPWSINPDVFKDWGLEKDIDMLLMGLVYVDPNNFGNHHYPNKVPPKGRYAFRDAVFEKLKEESGFRFHPHPGHQLSYADHLMVSDRYAKELNRSKIFYTCGSRQNTGGVAVLKFFEAPACNTLLLAEPNEDIQELGFVDEENYVACTVDNVVEKSAYYLRNDHERERISKNGYRLIHQFHNNDHRANEMINEIKKYL